MGIRVTLLLTLSLLVGASAGASLAQSQENRASLQGTVKEAGTGKPLAGARVEVREVRNEGSGAGGGGRPATFRVVTGEDGTFAIRDLAPGRYSVGAGAPLYASAGVTLNAEQDLHGVELFLRPLGVITGHVVDEAGEPLRNVEIYALRSEYGNCNEYIPRHLCGNRIWTRIRTPQNGQTNDRGEYRIYNLEPGTYRIVARDDDISEHIQVFYPGVSDPQDAGSIRLEAGQERSAIDIVLKPSPGFSVKFKLTGSGARDFGDPAIVFRRSGALEWEDEQQSPKALPDGSWRMEHLAPGSYEIFAYTPSADWDHTTRAYTGERTFRIRDEDVDLGSWELHSTVPVTGKIQTAGTLPAGFSPQDLRIVFADNNVPATYDNVPAFDYNYYRAERDLKRPDGLQVSSIAADGRFNIGDVAIGRFRIEVQNLKPETYLIAARSGALDVLDSGYPVTGDQAPLELTIGGPDTVGTVEGRVLDVLGKPVPRAAVVLVPPGERQVNLFAIRKGSSDESGAFKVRGVLPGTYRVLAWKDLDPAERNNPEFVNDFLGRGQTIEVTAGFTAKASVEAIPAPDSR